MIDITEKLENDLHKALQEFYTDLTTAEEKFHSRLSEVHAKFAKDAEARQEKLRGAIEQFVATRSEVKEEGVRALENELARGAQEGDGMSEPEPQLEVGE